MRRTVGRRLHGARLTLAVLLALALAAGPALAAFPGKPGESPRVNAPNDPEFDRCEPDEDTTPGQVECTSYWSEQYGLFGFGPASSTARYANPAQLDQAGRDANLRAGRPADAQISGVRADLAWKHSAGSPEVVIAILDTGIRWESRELVDKIHLNTRELPIPQGASAYDANGDGRVNVNDWAADPRVRPDGGEEEADGLLDASDLIAAFSDGRDADSNGYVDDIAGWDFFNDDNDPFDASSCCNADNHGSGRAEEAARSTNDGRGGAGLCPECQIMPLRVWDTFVVDTNLYALGTVYAADNGASVVEGAVGGLLNSEFARRAFTHADRKGVTLTLVSSDLNTANHNYPTNYNEAIYVAGTLPDTAPGDTCSTPGLPGLPVPEADIPGCPELLSLLAQASGGALQPSTQPPTTSFFRNANLTQYGGKADIVLIGATGSQNTGQASGAAGLIQSYARERFAGQDRFPRTLSGNEVRQILTMSAEDVLPENTGIIGLPDKARPGWDPHFGYGRVNLAGAMAMVAAGRIPPEAQLDAPDWFSPINVDRLPDAGVPIEGRVAAPHSASGVGEWRVEYACGQDALDRDFQPVPGASGNGAREGLLGRLSKRLLQRLADDCDGSIRDDAGLPAGRPSQPWPADPYPDPDPHRHAFQIRLTAQEAGDPENIGRYRKTLFAYRDDGLLPGWPKPIGSGSDTSRLRTASGGETPPRLFDMDGDNRLDIVLGTSSGELHVQRFDGRPLRSWNRGRPVRTALYAIAKAHRRPSGSLAFEPREPVRTPAIGDITGDGEPEVVATAGEHVYAWRRDGRRLRGFPQRVDPALSDPCKSGAPRPCFAEAERAVNRENHVKRGFFGSAALADLDEDGTLDIVAGALDQHVYAWNGRGRVLSGFPVKLSREGVEAGAEIIASPAVADLDGDRDPEIVIPTNEVHEPQPEPPQAADDILGAFERSATGGSVVYALHGDGKLVGGWPVTVASLLPAVLPLVGPGHDAAVLDVDGDGDDEVSLSATAGDAVLVDGDGSHIRTYANTLGAGDALDLSRQFNLFEYASVGDLSGSGAPAVIKGGASLGLVLNLAAPNQNFAFNHTVQAWDPRDGGYLPGFPVATDDYQLLSQPAIAKVGGGGRGRQALVGTGLYQLHAYGVGGTEPPGWPKFAGGWLFATPAVGDADGDGRLDVVSVTREGWSFAWSTATPACEARGAATNAEWWTFHHDEHGTAAHGHDARPPARPGSVVRGRTQGGSLRISFTAAGDDHLCGRAARYEVRGAREPIENARDFARATPLEATAASVVPAGDLQELDVAGAGRFRHLAVRAVDDAGNASMAGPPRRRCQPASLRVGRLGIGRLRIGQLESRLLGRAGQPAVRRRGVFRYCVRGGGGRLLVAFSPRGDARLVATTARTHRARSVGVGDRVAAIRRPRRALGRGVFSIRDGSTRLVVGARRGRVSFIAVVDRRLLKNRGLLRSYLRRAGLRSP